MSLELRGGASLDLDARPRVRLIGLRLLGRRAGGEERERIGGDRRAEGERHRHCVRVEAPEATAWLGLGLGLGLGLELGLGLGLGGLGFGFGFGLGLGWNVVERHGLLVGKSVG